MKEIKEKSMSEADIQNSIRLALSPYAIMFRVNTGKVRMENGRMFETGVPVGFPDLCGFRKSDGKAIYIEVKNAKGRLRKEQQNFQDTMKKYPVIIAVCRSADEAVDAVVNG